MASAEVEVAKLGATFLQTASQAESLCDGLEKGHDATLSTLFANLQVSFKAAHMPVLLVPLAAGAIGRTVDWLFGADVAPLVIECLDKFHVIEVCAGSPNFVLHAGHDGNLEADTANDLLMHVRLIVRDGSAAHDLPVLRLPGAASGLADVTLCIARDAHVLREQAAVLRRLLAKCNLAMFAAPSSYRLSETDAAFLSEVLPGFEAIAPIVLAEEQEAPTEPWWRGALPGNSVVLTEVTIPLPKEPTVGEDGQPVPPVVPEMPDVLKNPANACRQTLQLIAHSTKLISAMEAVNPRCESELKQLTAKQTPLAQRDKELDDKAKTKDVKGELDSIKGLLEDDLTQIQMFVEDANSRLTQRRGKFTTSLRELVEEVNEADFEDIIGTKTIRRSLTEEYKERMLSVVGRDLREQLKNDCSEVAKRIKDLNVELDEILTRIRGSEAHLELPMPDEKLIWHYLKGEICLDVRCEVERPKGGVIMVLTAGRKMMMPFFMTLGLIGFGSVRKSMASEHWQMGLVLIAACTYAYFEARSEQADKFSKELEKIKDTLTNETTKIINDVQKEKVSRLVTYLNMLKKSTMKRVDEQVKMYTEARTQIMDREKANTKNKLGSLQGRIKELQDFTKQMEKLQTAAHDLELNGRKLLLEAAKGTPAAPVRAGATAGTSRVSAASSTAAGAPPIRMAAALAAAAPATGETNGTTADAPARVSRIPDIPRPERPPREPRPERPVREPKEKKEEEAKPSAASRFAALRASMKK